MRHLEHVIKACENKPDTITRVQKLWSKVANEESESGLTPLFLKEEGRCVFNDSYNEKFDCDSTDNELDSEHYLASDTHRS